MRTLILLLCVAAITVARAQSVISPTPAAQPAPEPVTAHAPFTLLPVPDASPTGEAASVPASLPVSNTTSVPVRATGSEGLHFTLKQAEGYALANHPQIAGARLNAGAVRQEITEARSQFFPQIYAVSDSVDAPPGARIAASGGLNNPSVYSRQSDGATLSQLLFDFGHTYELTEAAHFRADAAADRLHVTQAVIILQVDRAYFDLLRAHAILRVAQQTVNERQLAFNQISVLAKNQIKSTLDASFAQVNLSEAKLLQIQGQSSVNDAEAELSTSMGFPDTQHFVLTEEPLVLSLPSSPDPLVHLAMNQRPELASLRSEQGAADRFARAQDANRYPKVSAIAAAGVSPVSDTADVKRTYWAAGVNVTAPLFTGGDLEAQARQARLLSDVALQNFIDAQNTISRDVRVAWQDAETARQRLDVTAELIQTANQEEKLASARYRLGTSSIVEFVQAQLDATQARLQDASARYDFQSGRALLNFTVGQNVVQP
jgi:outer membrane protein